VKFTLSVHKKRKVFQSFYKKTSNAHLINSLTLFAKESFLICLSKRQNIPKAPIFVVMRSSSSSSVSLRFATHESSLLYSHSIAKQNCIKCNRTHLCVTYTYCIEETLSQYQIRNGLQGTKPNSRPRKSISKFLRSDYGFRFPMVDYPRGKKGIH
jgi:hypothetical protein